MLGLAAYDPALSTLLKKGIFGYVDLPQGTSIAQYFQLF